MARIILRSFIWLCTVAAIGLGIVCVRSFWRSDEIAYFSYLPPTPPVPHRDLRFVVGSYHGGVFWLATETDLDDYMDWCGGPPTEFVLVSGATPELASAALARVASHDLPVPHWRRAGFWLASSTVRSPRYQKFRALVVPDWVPLLPLALLAALRFMRRRRQRHRRQQGRCPQCGYDLRASGAVCPECGRAKNATAAIPRRRRRRVAQAWAATAAIGAVMVAAVLWFSDRRFQGDEAHMRSRGTASGSNSRVDRELLLEPKPGVRIDFVLIPSGSFLMGAPLNETGRLADDQPPHHVTIMAQFFMGVTAVTEEQYEAVMGTNPSKWPGPHKPVENVSWNEAVDFCRRLSQRCRCRARLPTEAEWEYACRAGTTTPFNTGVLLTRDMANYCTSDSYPSNRVGRPEEGGPMPVGSFRPNGWGLYDMHGSVWQMCSDDLHPKISDLADPLHPEKAVKHPIRGGTWTQAPKSCRSAARSRVHPNDRFEFDGFRICVELAADGAGN